MGIESGSIGLIGAVSTGPSVGPAVSVGPSIGPAIGRVGSFINEGPVTPNFLENTMPLTLSKFNPVGEIMFNPFKEELSATDTIRAAENIISEAKTPPQTISVPIESGSVANANLPSEAEAVDIAEQWLGILKPRTTGVNKIEPLVYVAKPKNEPKIQPKVGHIEFSKTAPQVAGFTELNIRSAQPRLNRGQENAVGQNLQEEVLVKEKVKEKPEVLEIEEIEESKLKDLLDVEVAEQRVYEISEAIDLAQAEADKEGVEEIEGPRILKFIRLHIGLISQIARKIHRDGSLDETLEGVAARKFSSKNQAKVQTKELVFEKEPVRRGKEGKAVKEGALERVFKYYFVKRAPKEEVVSRVIKKQVIQTGHRKESVQVQSVAYETKEPRIEDNADLAEVFQRAA